MHRRLIAGRSIRWSDELAGSAYEQGLWAKDTIGEWLRRAAEQSPNRVLLVDGRRRVGCASLYAEASAVAGTLLERTPPGSVISFMLPNWHEAAVIYLAATLAGMVVNPILPSLRDRELSFVLEDVGARLIFVPSNFRYHDYPAMMSRIVGRLASPLEVVVLRGDPGAHTPYESLTRKWEGARPFPIVDPDSVRMVLHTSGTTGRPKGVLHTHNSIHALICQLREHWLIDPGDKFLIPSPVAHIGGSIYAFECPLLLGTTAVLMERWNAGEAVRLVDAECCTHIAAATPFLEQMLFAARDAGTRLPSLKLFVCGGASVPPSLIRAAASHFERAVVTRVYGSTEVPVITVGAVGGTDRRSSPYAADTDGRAGLAEIKLVGHDAAQAGEGEIRARGPQMLVGYLHPDDEADAFDEEGFFRTGDIGRWVDGGYLVVSGRAKDIIIRNGENISPKEVEDVLVGHPLIAEVAIVGLPDARTGERACAVIVVKAVPGPDVASLRAYLEAQGIATFKVPEQVVIWEALPKNDTGKVLKHKIRAALVERSS